MRYAFVRCASSGRDCVRFVCQRITACAGDDRNFARGKDTMLAICNLCEEKNSSYSDWQLHHVCIRCEYAQAIGSESAKG
ncbi:hypothetical protein MRX96_025144 [Rhipicephalus microplus]